jgi:hypothetical protein
MLVDHMLCTIDGARATELAQLGSDISRAYANGALGEDDHQRLWEAIDARRAQDRLATADRRRSAPRRPARPRRPYQRSPDRQASIERRRRLADLALPQHLSAKFTTAEKSALLVAGSEAVTHGCCTLCLDAIAARAGTCKTVVQEAFRKARKFVLLDVQERRRKGQRSLTNIVRIISKQWRRWLTKGSGFRKTESTDTSTNTQAKTTRPEGFGAQWQSYYRHYDPDDRSRRRYQRKQESGLAMKVGAAEVAGTSK